jgi:hypothetical protein
LPALGLPGLGLLVQSDDIGDDCPVCRFYSSAQLQTMQVDCVASTSQGSLLVTLPTPVDSAMEYLWFARGPPVAL